jgi:hypothetical protein
MTKLGETLKICHVTGLNRLNRTETGPNREPKQLNLHLVRNGPEHLAHRSDRFLSLGPNPNRTGAHPYRSPINTTPNNIQRYTQSIAKSEYLIFILLKTQGIHTP